MSDGTLGRIYIDDEMRETAARISALISSCEEAEFLLSKALDGFKAPEEQDRLSKMALLELQDALKKAKG